MKPVIPLGEARRRLPELVRKVAEGHPPITIGRRGRPEAVLMPLGTPTAATRRPLSGLIELVDRSEALDGAETQIREQFAASLERTSALLVGAPNAMRTPPKTPRARARRPARG